MSNKRAAIIELHRAGKKKPEIVKLSKAPKSTVYHTLRRFKNWGLLRIRNPRRSMNMSE